MVNEKSLAESFRKIKADIMSIQGEILEIKEEQGKTLLKLNFLTEKLHAKKPVKKKSKKRTSKSKK